MPWAPDYVTPTELKDYARIGDTPDDVQIQLAITSASRAVDSTTYRQFGQVTPAEARTYTPRWDHSLCRWVIVIDDLMDQTGLTVVLPMGTITLFKLAPANAAQRGRPWTRIVVDKDSAVKPKGEDGEATVTALWGWTAVPATVKQATLLQALRFFKRRDAPFGIAGSPETGSEMRLLAKVDPDVAVALKPYIRWLRVRQTVG